MDTKLKGLRWITPRYPNNPLKEINLLKETIKIINKDNRSKLVMTDYQFLSFLTEKNLNIPLWLFPVYCSFALGALETYNIINILVG